MDFSNAKELLELCDSNKMSISEVMKQRECDESTSSKEEITEKMRRVLQIMRDSATMPINTPMKSMGGLIGGEAKKLSDYRETKKNISSSVLSRGMMYAMAVLECNASMGLIVAAPTAGSSGVVPGLLLVLQDMLYRRAEQRLRLPQRCLQLSRGLSIHVLSRAVEAVLPYSPVFLVSGECCMARSSGRRV